MAAQVSVSTDEPITERLLQYSSNPQKVRIVLSKLLRWAKKPDIRIQTSLMTSEEAQYADILIARGAQRKHLAKETDILQTEAARLGRSKGEIEIGKSICQSLAHTRKRTLLQLHVHACRPELASTET